jgi:predicted peptidase
MKACLLCFAAVFAILLSPMTTRAQTTYPPLPSASFKWKLQRSGELKYLLQLPPEYSNKKNAPRWPLMLFLHGAGERGTDVQRASIHGPLKLVRQGTHFPFIIVAPVCPAKERWQTEPLLQLLDKLEKSYRVDTNRVYVTGLSMGGYGTWALGLATPERFAAIAPICGGANLIDVILGSRDRERALKSLPIWAFHGAKDPVVPLEESERVVNALEKAGAKNVKLTVYPEALHDSWSETYANPAFYEWLLAQRR